MLRPLTSEVSWLDSRQENELFLFSKAPSACDYFSWCGKAAGALTWQLTSIQCQPYEWMDPHLNLDHAILSIPPPQLSRCPAPCKWGYWQRCWNTNNDTAVRSYPTPCFSHKQLHLPVIGSTNVYVRVEKGTAITACEVATAALCELSRQFLANKKNLYNYNYSPRIHRHWNKEEMT